MTDNVISLGTKRPLSEERANIEKMSKLHEEIVERNISENAKEMITLLTAVIKLVESGQVDSLALVARDSKQGVFLSDLMISPSAKIDTYHAFIGKLEAVKLEALDGALSGPDMMPDGGLVMFEAPMDMEDIYDSEDD